MATVAESSKCVRGKKMGQVSLQFRSLCEGYGDSQEQKSRRRGGKGARLLVIQVPLAESAALDANSKS